MTFFSTNPPVNRSRPMHLWRSVLRSVIALVDGETVSRRHVTPLPYDTPTTSTSCDLISSDLIENRDVYVIDFEDGLLFDQVDDVAFWAASVRQVATIETLMSMILTSSADDVLVVVNIDTINDTETAVESLIALKLACPNVPVVIGSATFSKNNFTHERRAVTDASVRLPCSSVTLALAIESSVSNSHH